MPIFEYRCGECGHVTAFLEKAGRRGPHACEECGSRQTEKLFSTFAPQSGSSPAPPRAGCQSCSTESCPYSAGRL